MQARPPSRQKLPHQAQNLDDHSSAEKIRGASGRPRIDAFQRNLKIMHQSSEGGGGETVQSMADDFASQYAAMSQNAIRPPSRHKDPPQNMGLDLPSDQEVPSLDEDSGSSEEFEIGIAQAG